MVAVEKGSAKGVCPERSTTRIVVAGDSTFLDNQVIDAADNRNFARYAINWLLDQRQLMQVGPHAVTEYKLMLTRTQMTSIRWIFLAGMPGAILAFGGFAGLAAAASLNDGIEPQKHLHLGGAGGRHLCLHFPF